MATDVCERAWTVRFYTNRGVFTGWCYATNEGDAVGRLWANVLLQQPGVIYHRHEILP